MNIPVEYFPTIDGSMTSADGMTFYLKVTRDDGGELMLGFPHTEILNIVEHAAVQAGSGRDEDGKKEDAAFVATSFQLGNGSNGEPVLSLAVGHGGKISFRLPTTMPNQLFEALAKLQTRH
jgi:hypothetical protein